MRWTRRDWLGGMGGAALGLTTGRMARAAAGDGELAAVLPFRPLSDLRRGTDGRLVLAQWHNWRISIDNAPPARDAYARRHLSPDGREGRFREAGGFMRERPLPRPPRPRDRWITLDMMDEVRRAAAIGMDAFAFNIVDLVPDGVCWKSFRGLLEATDEVGQGFKITPSVDVVAMRRAGSAEVAAALQSVITHPAMLRDEAGRVVVMAFKGDNKPAEWWQDLFARLGRATGVEIAFYPIFLNREGLAALPSAMMAGAGLFGPHTLAAPRWLMATGRAVQDEGRRWIAPVVPQDVRPKSLTYTEAGNSRMFRAFWQASIELPADWVQIATWNDYSESTEIAPSTGIQYAFYDLAAYYIAWYKTATAPPITRDVLYYFYRNHPVAAAPNDSRQTRPFRLVGPDRTHDEIELLAFLTSPGRLEIEIDGQVVTGEVPAGISALYAPLRPGRPRFGLYRGGRELVRFEGAFEIRDRIGFQDLLYRGGSSTRPPVQMVADRLPG